MRAQFYLWHCLTENSRAYLDAVSCTLPASRQAHVEFLDESGEWRRHCGTQAKVSNALILRKSSHTSLNGDHLEHQGGLKQHATDPDPDPDVTHNEGAVGLVPLSYDCNPVYHPFSPPVNFDEFLTIPMSSFGSPSVAQTHIFGVDDAISWELPSGSSILNAPFDFPPFLCETSVGLPSQENTASWKGARSVPVTQSHLEDARNLIESLVQYGKMTQFYKTGTSTKTEMPDVEDVMESLQSLLPETETPSPELSGLNLSVTNVSSSSNLFKTLIYSFTNNFAGLRDVPRKSLMQLLRHQHDIRTPLFELIKSGQPGVAKPLADNLFRAAVEGCDANAVATIIHHTKSNPKIAIDPNEVVCNFENTDYTPIELAAKFRDTELVRTLVASRADPNKTYRQEQDKYWEKGALALALGHWVNGSEYPYLPSPAGEPEPVNLDLLRLLLDCGAEVRMDLAENAMRPGPGNTAIAEELFSRIPASDHHTCFRSQWFLISMIHYLENGAANRFIRRIVADCFESTNCGKCISENPKLVERMLCHAARRSNIELSKFLVQYTGQLQSALAAAVRAASEELVQFLLDRGAHVDDQVESLDYTKYTRDQWGYMYSGMYDENGYDRPISSKHHFEYVITPIRTPLAEAIRARNDHLIRFFERLGGLTRLADEHHFQAAILAAAEVGNTSYLKKILEHGHRSYEGAALTLALAVAIRNDETDAALVLLDAGASPQSYQRRYGNPFVNALERRNKRAVDSMLECDVYYRYTMNNEKFATEVAASWCGVEVIKDLIRLGGDINAGVETTALGAAVRSGNRTLVHQLLDLGAKPKGYAMGPNGVTPLRAALEIGDYDMARFLISKGADPADSTAFTYAMGHNPAGYEVLLSEFKSQYPHGLPNFGGSLLAKAIELDDLSLVDSLLGAGADVNSWCKRRALRPIDVDGPMNNQRVLGFAINHRKGRCNELVRKLLNKGANPDYIASEREVSSENGVISVLETPLVLAIKMRNSAMMSLLLEHGADLNMPARRGVKRTPLQAACETGNYRAVEFLLQRGASVNSPAAERDGGTALQMAAKTGSLRIVKLLLDNYADPHMAKSKVGGRTAFEAAAESGCIDILCLLWDAVLPFGFSEKESQSAKGFAKQKGHRGCVDFIDFLTGGSSQSFLDQ